MIKTLENNKWNPNMFSGKVLLRKQNKNVIKINLKIQLYYS